MVLGNVEHTMDAESQKVIEELQAEIERLKVFETEVNSRCWNEMVLANDLFKANQEIVRLKSLVGESVQ
jgi:hypothetical protein